jgi:hypothetical protein
MTQRRNPMPKKLKKNPPKKPAAKKAATRTRQAKPAPIARHSKTRPTTPKAHQTTRRQAMTDATKSAQNASSEENTDPNTHGKPGTGRAGNAMTTARHGAQRTKDNSPRGAGSGEEANIMRQLPDRETVPPPIEVTDYEDGDADAGRLDYNAQAQVDADAIIPMRDRRAYLIQQAERNEAANDELNFIQVQKNRRAAAGMGVFQDPDYQRETSMQTAIAALGEPDIDKERERIQRIRKLRAERYDNPNYSGVGATTARETASAAKSGPVGATRG